MILQLATLENCFGQSSTLASLLHSFISIEILEQSNVSIHL
jgi:hypothetical protein